MAGSVGSRVVAGEGSIMLAPVFGWLNVHSGCSVFSVASKSDCCWVHMRLDDSSFIVHMRLDDSSFIVGSIEMYGRNGVAVGVRIIRSWKRWCLGSFLLWRRAWDRSAIQLFPGLNEIKSMWDNDSTYTVLKIVGGLVNCSLDEDWTDSWKVYSLVCTREKWSMLSGQLVELCSSSENSECSMKASGRCCQVSWSVAQFEDEGVEFRCHQMLDSTLWTHTHTRAVSSTSISEFNTILNKDLISTSHKSRHLTISYTARICQSLAQLL